MFFHLLFSLIPICMLVYIKFLGLYMYFLSIFALPNNNNKIFVDVHWKSSVLRFLCKAFSKLLKLTLLKIVSHGWFLKISYIQINICITVSLWELQSDLSLKDASSSTEWITWSSVILCRQMNENTFVDSFFFGFDLFMSLFFSSVCIFVFEAILK